MPLTPKQQRFVDEYTVDLNATQAAIRAGVEWSETARRFYVYFLVDPRNHQIFYVGKGKGYRVRSHARAKAASNGAKDARISDIHANGDKVVEIVAYDNLTETDALNCEREFIAALRSHGLTNISGGCVSNHQALMEKIEMNIKHTHTYDRWVNGISDATIASVSRVFGGTREFYDWYVGQWAKLRDKVAANG